MSKEKLIGKIYRHKVTFSLKAPKARQVFLVGDFNNWDTAANSMKLDKDGSWKLSKILPPRRYEYKFYIDGKWREGSKDQQAVPNKFGILNHVLIVPEKGE